MCVPVYVLMKHTHTRQRSSSLSMLIAIFAFIFMAYGHFAFSSPFFCLRSVTSRAAAVAFLVNGAAFNCCLSHYLGDDEVEGKHCANLWLLQRFLLLFLSTSK